MSCSSISCLQSQIEIEETSMPTGERRGGMLADQAEAVLVLRRHRVTPARQYSR